MPIVIKTKQCTTGNADPIMARLQDLSSTG